MTREAALAVLALALAAGTTATAQGLRQKLAAAKRNAAQNQQALPDGTRYAGSNGAH